MRPRPCALVHVGITVPDLDAAVAWYEEVLGCDRLLGPIVVDAADGHAGTIAADVFGPRFRRFRQAQLSMANGVGIELFEFVEPPTERRADPLEFWRTGVFHLCVREPDVAGLARRIAATGGRMRTPVHQSFAGEPYRWCYCEDPFGTIVEIYSHSHEQVFANRR
jgi:catechol 2,3-dioxygenase-like lactoylglutathione lyase family enzyme